MAHVHTFLDTSLVQRVAITPEDCDTCGATCPTHGRTHVTDVSRFTGFAGGNSYTATLACGCTELDESGDVEAAR
jgi:hypothetical protein